MTKAEPMGFPAYLMKGDTVEFDGKLYLIPEPVACRNARELAVFLYDKRVQPLGAPRLRPSFASA